MEQLTWEQAKQKVAEKTSSESIYDAVWIDISGLSTTGEIVKKALSLCDEAAELMNSKNLERIKEHEEIINEQLRRIHGQEGRIQGQANKIIKHELRIKESEKEKHDLIISHEELCNAMSDRDIMILEKQLRIKELEEGLKESTELLGYAIDFNDKRSLTDKLTGKNLPKESEKSSWTKRSEKSVEHAKQLLK